MVDFVSLCVYSGIVKQACHSLNAGDPAVGMAIEMGTHISEDDIWHLWLGVHLGVCNSPLVVSSGTISGNSLGPFRCVSQFESVANGYRVLLVDSAATIHQLGYGSDTSAASD